MASFIFDSRGARFALTLHLLRAASPAQAAAPAEASEAAKSAAEAKLADGVDQLKNRRYDAALARFQEAYSLVPSPLISYDFGLAYIGLGDQPRALESFDAFLLEAPHAPDDKRRKARQHADELRGQVAVVTLSAQVATIELTVDGRQTGQVAVPRRLYLAPGWHEVIARDGAASASATVTCAGGQTLTLDLSLTAPAAIPAPRPAPLPAALIDAPGSPATVTVQDAGRPAPHRGARIGAISAAAVGAVSLGLGLTFGVMAGNQGDAVTADSMNRRDFVPGAESAGLRDQRLEVVFLSVGAVALAAAAGLYALARR
jgi:hypothetical protein